MTNYLYNWIGILLIIGFLIGSCAVDADKLIGEWQAVAFFENGHSVQTELDSVSLHFTGTSFFEFRSQGFYREAGSYRVSASYLFLEDTTAKPKQERTVKILYLSADTLKIEMKQAKNKQVLFFKRKS
jgi:hypothetical protein